MATLGLLSLLGLLALVVVGVLVWRDADRPASEAAPQLAPPVDDLPRMENPNASRALAENFATEPARPGYPDELFDERRYDGVARVEVHVSTSNGSALPQKWRLTLEPAVAMIGSHRAVARAIEIDDGRDTVVIDDVQLGSYAIRAQVEHMDCAPELVALSTPESIDVILALRVHPLGFITGRVVDSDGRPIDGIDVVLASATAMSLQPTAQLREPRVGTCDALGVYLFENVADGDYRIYVGDPELPLGQLADVSFAAPSLHAPDVVVPPLGELEVRVTDRAGRPIAGAVVEGNGLRSGKLRLTTDFDGRARARHCAKGRQIFYASEERFGSANAVADFDPAAPQLIEITIGP